MKKSLLFSLIAFMSLNCVKVHAADVAPEVLAISLGANTLVTAVGLLLGCYIKDPVQAAVTTGAMCTLAPLIADKALCMVEGRPSSLKKKYVMSSIGFLINFTAITMIAAKNYSLAYYGPLYGFLTASAIQTLEGLDRPVDQA